MKRSSERPDKFRSRPVKVEAMFYEATPESAAAVVNWLVQNNHPAKFVPANGYYTESIKIGSDSIYQPVAPNRWVVLDRTGSVHVMSDSSFKAAYKRNKKKAPLSLGPLAKRGDIFFGPPERFIPPTVAQQQQNRIR